LNGEWAIFTPAASTTGGNATEGKTESGKDAEVGKEAGEINLTGTFNRPITVQGGLSKQDILFPANVSATEDIFVFVFLGKSAKFNKYVKLTKLSHNRLLEHLRWSTMGRLPTAFS